MSEISDRAWNQDLLKQQIIILEAIATYQPLSHIIRQLIETVETLIPNRIASFLFYDPKQNCLGSGEAINLPDEYVQALEGLAVSPKAGCCGTAAYRKQPVIVSDIASDPLWENFRDLPLTYGLRAAWSYPILGANNELLGTFCCYCSTVAEPTKRDLELTQVISHLAALAITQDRIRKERDQKLALVEAAVDGIGIFKDDYFCYLNQAHANIFGYESPSELIGRSWEELYESDEVERVKQEIFPAVKQQGYWQGRMIAKRKDGTTFPQDLSLTLVDQKQMICVGRDISDRVQAELDLQESEQRYQLAAEGAKVGVWDWNLETNEVYVAPNLKALLGYHDHEIPNTMQDWTQLVHPDDVRKVNQAIENHLAGTTDLLEVEHRMVHKNGSILWFLARGQYQSNPQGRADRIIGSNTDITDRKEAELAREVAIAAQNKRDRYLQSLTEIQQKLLTAPELTISVYQEILSILGPTAQASRAYFFKIHHNENQQWVISQQAEWCAEGVPPEIDNSHLQNLPIASAPLLSQAITTKTVYSNYVNNLPSPEQEILTSQGIQSILILPLFVDHELFGLIGFDQCDYPREWEAIETNLLSWAANSIAIAQEKQQSQQALIESETKYRSIFENITQGIFQVTLDGKYLSANTFLAHLYGFDFPDELIQTITNIPEQLYINPKHWHELIQSTLQAGMVTNVESQVYRRDGTTIWISVTQKAVYDQQQGHFLYFEGIVEDITARKQAEDQLYYQAFHDGLTGLWNRTWFVQTLESAINAYEQGITENCYAVFFIDLNRFKIINDSLGHIFGDEILKQVAHRLDNQASSDQFIARFGGDEFALLATDIVNQQDCCQIAQQLLNRFKEPFFLKGNRYSISASIGIALGDLYYQSPEEVLRDADAAMYDAKAKGKGYMFFETEIRERVLSSLWLENDLEGAIERGEFQLRYQPLVYLATNELYGFEVLLRWFHPQRGAISPGHFIPIAEESGVIKELDAWVLRQSCRQLYQWQTQFSKAKALVISINLSPVELLQPNFVKRVEATLNEAGISPHCIHLELTETAFLDDTCLKIFQQLQALGVQISIDDFGTGQSSLSRLHQIPLSTIKIDRAFVRQFNQGSSSEAIVQTILTLANCLGVNTLSEGIETAQQRDTLINLGCLLGQGYFYSSPVPARVAANLLEAGHVTN